MLSVLTTHAHTQLLKDTEGNFFGYVYGLHGVYRDCMRATSGGVCGIGLCTVRHSTIPQDRFFSSTHMEKKPKCNYFEAFLSTSLSIYDVVVKYCITIQYLKD